MRHHYLPQFLLRRFADEDGLWQFDIHTGSFERRSVQNAGQKRHFYSVELETGLLQRIDGEAGAIFSSGLVGRDGQVLVVGADRVRLARWLALFAVRTPQTFENFKEHVEQALRDPQQAIDVMYEGRDRVLELVQRSSPAAYRSMIEQFGSLAGEELVLAAFAASIRQGKVDIRSDAKTSFVNYINEARVEDFAARLLRFQWVWLTTDRGFIIGDNPLCRWSTRKGVWNYGINHRDTEITIPLSRTVCLRLQRRPSRATRALYCNRELAQIYNRRQLISSVYNAFGAERRLRPMAAKVVAKAVRVGKLDANPRHAP